MSSITHIVLLDVLDWLNFSFSHIFKTGFCFFLTKWLICDMKMFVFENWTNLFYNRNTITTTLKQKWEYSKQHNVFEPLRKKEFLISSWNGLYDFDL